VTEGSGNHDATPRLIKPLPRLSYEEAVPRRKLNSALSPRSLLSLLAMFLAAFQLPTSRMDEGTLLVYPRAGFEGKTAVP
jgi:hypothetical protein